MKKFLILICTATLVSCGSSNREDDEVIVQLESSAHDHPHNHDDLLKRIEKLEGQDYSGEITSEEGRALIELINRSSPYQIKK